MKGLFFFALIFLGTIGRPQELKVGDLRCAYSVNPLGVESVVPRLSWEIGSGRRGVLQTAYRVLVTEETLSAGNGSAKKWVRGIIVFLLKKAAP